MFSLFNGPYDGEKMPNGNDAEERNAMDFDTLQKARQDLIGEIQAIKEYDAHIHSSNDRLAKETWKDIKDEELVHVGELLGLLDYLDPSQKQFVQKGLAEFTERKKSTR